MDLNYIVLFLFVLHLSAACDSERLFFGSINESYPLHVDKNGVYIKQADPFDDFPIYKHESREFYMYHVSGNILPTSFWVIGTTPGSLSVSISIQTHANTPNLATEKWRIWSAENGHWKPQRHLSATCVEETFGTCKSGRIRLHGLSPWNHHQRNRTGTYVITDQTYQLRPVYQHKHEDDYMYYLDGLWMVGPEVGRVSTAMFVLDYAWRPEFITDTWIVFNGNNLLRDTRLNVKCIGQPDVNPVGPPHSDDATLSVSDIIDVAEGMLGEEGAQLPVCDARYCQNLGTCIQNAAGAPMCACIKGYEGDKCQHEVTCGDPPAIEHGYLVSHTGQGHLEHAFYDCHGDFVLQGATAAICQWDGEWGRRPVCVHWLDYINPGISATAPSRRSLGHRRSQRHHRRNRRHSVADLKSLF